MDRHAVGQREQEGAADEEQHAVHDGQAKPYRAPRQQPAASTATLSRAR